MPDYAIVYNGDIKVEQTGELATTLKAINEKVKAISIVHYTKPQVVVLHCGENELEETELDYLRAALPPIA